MQTFLLASLFVLGSIALSLASYFAMRAIVRQEPETQSRDLAGSVIFRVSALHGLILALVFAQEMVEYQRLQSNIVAEATAVADIYNDIARHGGEERVAVQQALSDYVRIVAGREWMLLGSERRLSKQGWDLREKVYLALLDLDESTPRREALREHMLVKIQAIAEFRQIRENVALHRISFMFWFAAIAGVVLVTIPYFIFPPTKLNLALLAVFGAYTGIVMLFIHAFSDPFSEPGMLQPAAFERLLETEIGRGPGG